MNNNLDQILADLYQSDPSLKAHDAALRKLVVELMEVKPETQFDEQFRQDLRRKLMGLAEQQENKSLLTFNFMKKFQLVGAGAALMALLVVSAWYFSGVQNSSQNNLTAMITEPKITKISANAFGNLANLQQGSGRGQGGGGNGNASMAAESSALTVAPDAAVGMGSDAKLIAPVGPNYRYVYNGEPITLTEGQLEVLKRDKDQSSSNISDFINRASLGLINLNSFNNTKLQSFSFFEDNDMGYNINVSLTEGMVNINEYYPKWQALYMPCMDTMSSQRDMCAPQERIKPEEVPADDVVINAANAFLSQHNIPTAIYGTPFVNSDWRIQYERASNKNDVWIPDMVNVVYPLMIDGQTVYDESGNPSGMNVSVRFKPELKVSSVYDLTTQNYQSSAYTAETDTTRVMALVEKGGFRNYYYADPAAKTTVDIELGTPQISFVKLWNYKDGSNEELLVPALIFPVTKHPENVEPYYWYRKNIVIPLVKEILDQENADLPVRIMPAEGGATEPAVDVTPTAPAVDAAR